MKIKVNNYLIKNNKIKTNKTLLCLSDTHGNIKAINKIIKVIKNIKIDYILIPGDITDKIHQTNQELFLDKIIELSKYAKTYICLGNHDLLIDKNNKEKILVKDMKNTLLYKKLNNQKNIYLSIDDINTISLDDEIDLTLINLPAKYYSRKVREDKEVFDDFISKIDDKNINTKKYNISLVHSPNAIIRKDKIIDNHIFNKLDLTLCGHNHGGLTPIFIQDLFHNHVGFVGPFCVLIQKNCYGKYLNDNKGLIISNGVTKASELSPFKILHGLINFILPPEIEIIKLENGDNYSIDLIKRTNYKI